MIWLAWRQFRQQAIFIVLGLAALALLMIPTGLVMHSTFDELGLPQCLAGLGDQTLVGALSEPCLRAIGEFRDDYGTLILVAIPFIVLPLFVGLFWGAPLVSREIEHGTHRLVWTQGVGRREWAAVKFALIGGAALVVAVGYGFGMSWWLGPISQTGSSRFNPFSFDLQGLAPVGYSIFAVALGIFAGTICKKVLLAMAVTLAGFVGLRIALTLLGRPRYLPPQTLVSGLQPDGLQPNPFSGDWVQSQDIRDAAGNLLLGNAQAGCAAPGDCGADFGAAAFNWQVFQPADRFWLFQGIETGIYVALAALLLYLAFRRIRVMA